MDCNNIYQTSHTPLAVLLSTLGVPFAEDENGNARPFLLVYDPPTLRKHGYKGWDIFEAATDAFAKGKPGIITYQFQRTATLEKLIEGYNKRLKSMSAADRGDGPAHQELDIDPVQAAMFAAQLFRNRSHLINGWKTAQPMVLMPGGVTTGADPDRPGGKVITGSAKMISLNAGPELRQKIGL
jgi:hypothetical protein